jgi:hypothetical protein
MNKRIILCHRVILTILIVCVGFLTFTISCNTEKITPTVWTTWFDNPKEYATNNLDVAQEETPFTIILPSYLPYDLNPIPVIQGRAKSEFLNQEPITINYYKNGGQIITILEYNMVMETVRENDSTLLVFGNIEVLEMTTSRVSVIDKKYITEPGYVYNWNKGGVHYNLHIFEFARDEGRKIVESMINW